MLTDKIARFLEQEANVGGAGTRDAKLTPHVHRVTGWRLAPDRKTLTVLVPQFMSEHLVESLADNGQIAVTIEAFPSHETYQFKGKGRRTRAADDADRQVTQRIRERWIRGARTLFGAGADDMLTSFFQDPDIAVDVEIEEVFLQTPGPGAGKRLIPDPES